MRLARTTRRIKNLFLITKLNMVFDSYDSVEDALVGQSPKDQ